MSLGVGGRGGREGFVNVAQRLLTVGRVEGAICHIQLVGRREKLILLCTELVASSHLCSLCIVWASHAKK